MLECRSKGETYLHLDVQDTYLSLLCHVLHGLDASAVVIPRELGVLDEGAFVN